MYLVFNDSVDGRGEVMLSIINIVNFNYYCIK